MFLHFWASPETLRLSHCSDKTYNGQYSRILTLIRWWMFMQTCRTMLFGARHSIYHCNELHLLNIRTLVLFSLQYFLCSVLDVYYSTQISSSSNLYTYDGHYATNRKVAGSIPDELNFSIYLIFPVAPGPGVYSASNRNEYQKHKNNNVSGE
jgi:hypothetical protein